LRFVLNISAVTIGRSLWLDPTVREKALALAEQTVSTTTTDPNQSTTTTPPPTAVTPTTKCPTTGNSSATSVGVDTLCEIGLPIGWSSTAWPGWDWYLPVHLLGIVAVAIAASFGAPFWFGLLNRVVNLRAGGVPPPPAAEKRSTGAVS